MSAEQILEALVTYCATMRDAALAAELDEGHPVPREVYKAARTSYQDVLDQVERFRAALA